MLTRGSFLSLNHTRHDLAWLNSTITSIAGDEPQKEVVVTHNSWYTKYS